MKKIAKRNVREIIGKRTLVRRHYLAKGYKVKVDKGGHVEFRTGNEPWRDGRWLTEYRVFDGRVMVVGDNIEGDEQP